MLKNITITTRQQNAILYDKMLKTIESIDCIKIPFNNYINDNGSYEYLYDIIANTKTKWVINIDEDCFITNVNRLLDLIHYMEENNFGLCGMPDGGVCKHRFHNPVIPNPFFNIFNAESIRNSLNKEEIKCSIFNESFKNNSLMKMLNMDYNFDNFEPYYIFFYWILTKNIKTLYLNCNQLDDEISTVLKDHTNNDFAIHTWYAREYNKNSVQTNRINKVLERFL